MGGLNHQITSRRHATSTATGRRTLPLIHTGVWLLLSAVSSFPVLTVSQPREATYIRQRRQTKSVSAAISRSKRGQADDQLDRNDGKTDNNSDEDETRDSNTILLDNNGSNQGDDTEEAISFGEDTFLGSDKKSSTSSSLMEGDQGIRGGTSQYALPWYGVFQDSTLCGGSLIWGDIFLTASHCVDDNVSGDPCC